jgi:hypothetical protein
MEHPPNEELPTVHITVGPHDSVHACPLDADVDGYTDIPLGLGTAGGPPEIKCLRVSWLEGYDTPLVEMWAEQDREGCDGPANYAYWRVSQPWVVDEQEWLRLRGTANMTTFVPSVPGGGESPPAPTRESLIERAKQQHDRECSCDPKYLMSCPRMVQAILGVGKP